MTAALIFLPVYVALSAALTVAAADFLSPKQKAAAGKADEARAKVT